MDNQSSIDLDTPIDLKTCISWMRDCTDVPEDIITAMENKGTVAGAMEFLRNQKIYKTKEAEEARAELRTAINDHNMTIDNLCGVFARHAAGEIDDAELERQFKNSRDGMNFYFGVRKIFNVTTAEKSEFPDLELKSYNSLNPVLALKARLVYQFWNCSDQEIRQAFKNSVSGEVENSEVVEEDGGQVVLEVKIEMQDGILHYDVIQNGQRKKDDFRELGFAIFEGLIQRKILCLGVVEGIILTANLESNEHFRIVTSEDLHKEVLRIIDKWLLDKKLERQAQLSAESTKDGGWNPGVK